MKKIRFYDNAGNVLIPEGVSGGMSIQNDIDLLPKNAKIYITSALLTPNAETNTISPLTSSKNVVGNLNLEDVTLRFESDSMNFTDYIEIAYQGATSIAAPKKGFTIDTKKKHRFGTWIKMDSFHLKGYFTDWMHCRDLVCNRLYEQIMRSHITGIRPFDSANNFDNDYRQRVDVGAMCHIDGFPVELYINDVYWGLYSLNIKKNRDNYLLKKADTAQIQIEMADFTNLNSNFNWSTVEIRNPKSDSGNKSFTEGAEPNLGEVKTSWTNFMSFMNALTEGTSKELIETHLNIQSFIDSLLLADLACVWDSFVHNSLFTTWNGVQYSILMYDMDLTWGIENDFKTTYPQGNALVSATYRTFYRNTADIPSSRSNTMNLCVWFPKLLSIYATEINARYAELRKSIFTLQNVIGLFDTLTRDIGFNVYKDDLTRWDYPSYTDISDGVERIADWLKQRLAYLDEKYGYSI